MRDPDALRHERERLPSSGRRGHCDSRQPRVPAGQSGGGQCADTGRSAGQLARAQQQPSPSLEELARACALDPAKVAADFANTFVPGIGRVDPLTGQVRTMDWVKQQARQMEQLVRELQKQLCSPA